MEIPQWLADLARDRSLTPKMRTVVGVLGTQPKLASFASSREIAQFAQVDNATVVRTAQALGFDGWLSFRSEIRAMYIGSLTAAEVAAEHSGRAGHPATRAVNQDVDNIALLARRLDPDKVDGFAAAIAGARHTVAIGAGSYGAMALLLSHVATVLGVPVQAELRGGSHLANALGRIEDGGCLVAVGLWRLHRETMQAAELAAARGAAVCVITDSATSPLAEVADHVLVAPSESGGFSPSLTAGMCTVNAVLAALEQHAGTAAQASIARMEGIWQDLGLYHRP